MRSGRRSRFTGACACTCRRRSTTKTWAFVGAGKAGELLACLTELFDELGALVLDDGVSQGATTTFRGTLRARRGRDFYTYRFRTSFRATGAHVAEAWIEITPPATLMECLQ